MNLKDQIQEYKPYNEQEEVDKEVMLKALSDFDNVLTRDNKICHFSASNWIVNKERTKILMVYHNIYNSWSWTGGHSDGESDLLKVALREAEEETGLKNIKLLSDGIFSIETLCVNSHIKRGEFIPAHLHMDCCYLFEADEKEPLRIKEDENSGIKWVDIDKVLDATTEEQMKVVYTKLNKKLMEEYIV